MDTLPSLPESLAAVRDAIGQAAAAAGRDPAEIELVAVSKTHAPETVREVAEAGQAVFGESRIQEAKMKIPLLPSRLRWHFIGHLQKNKIRAALPLFELFHSIDSLDLARHLDRIAAEDGQRPRILLEVNVAGESSKFGFAPETLRAQLDELLALNRLEIGGLMTIAPYAAEAENSRPYFRRLRELRDSLQDEAGVGLPQLSMGMSGDYRVAIAEGATLVRVGSAIFGERAGKQWRPGPDAPPDE
jgi:pyridoxal phosphate enzyme (YggS family)